MRIACTVIFKIHIKWFIWDCKIGALYLAYAIILVQCLCDSRQVGSFGNSCACYYSSLLINHIQVNRTELQYRAQPLPAAQSCM
ncbi:hypothetical protein GDO78_022278 [Eleutherodactylus coqui]|uniref:Uncharacterized protein n=1 Tax=Eleutherodactylus coqui TaxID=57060 RepID=A0A8J6C1T8_ELECQ|nr:hypothetical protein GDO78_022278 [Eleutherodactylus coqui]